MKRKSGQSTTKIDPTYGATDLVEFLGINAATFQQWMNRGIVPFTVVKRGGRTYRRFTYDHVNTIAIIRALHAQGIEPSVAKQLAAHLAPYIADIKERDNEGILPGIEDFERESSGAGRTQESLARAVADHVARLEAPVSAGPYDPVCVIGRGVTVCMPSDSLDDAFDRAGSDVCFIVNLSPILRRLELLRVKLFIRNSPTLRLTGTTGNTNKGTK
jgi:DNA-binding transcriptional MerR regulator